MAVIQANKLWIKRDGGIGEYNGVNKYFNLYSGGKCLGSTTEIFTVSVRFSHVNRHGVKFLDRNNEDEGQKGVGLLPISW